MNFIEKFVPRKEEDQPEPEKPEHPDVQPEVGEVAPTPEIDTEYQIEGNLERIKREEEEEKRREEEINQIIDIRDNGIPLQ